MIVQYFTNATESKSVLKLL